MKKIVLLPDLHHPFHNKLAWKVVLVFLKWFRPDMVVLVGDALDMSAISHWEREKGNLKSFEGKRLKKDYLGFAKDILTPIEKACPKAEKIFMYGNHEDWQYQLVDQNPQMEGLVEIENVLNLKERGWKWIPFLIRGKHGSALRGRLKLGKLTVVHGEYTNKYHSNKTAETYLKSVLYAHTHDLQLFTKVTVEDPSDFHTCQSIGCLCDKSPQYLWGKPNRWVHAFGIVYLRDDGSFNVYVPIIIKGHFTYADKTF
jgi:hypothetical protein